MKKIKLNHLFTLLLLLLGFGAQAVTIDGHVYFGENDPIPGIEVAFYDAEIDNGALISQTVTDDSGYFSQDFEQGQDLPNTIAVVVYDVCFDVELLQLVDLSTDFNTVDFIICREIIPPTDSLCAAAFTYQQIDADGYIVQFTDLSYSSEDIIGWEWTFGDGESSNEQNPTHEYAETGLYDVSLTITTDSCSSTNNYFVEVLDETWCNCPDIWDPVCVATPTMDTITFPNICFAECEGFTDADIVDCVIDSSCICPDIWDPVCVATEDGAILSFGNLCEAECEGFTIDDVVDCEGDCDCPDIYEPVCVLVPGSIFPIEFPNACFAECEGFTPDQFVDCDSSGCDCPDVWDPVCVATDDGLVLTYGNLCEAECEGFTQDDIVDCVDPCICPDIWDPVCVLTEDSIRLTFGNLCEAECAGFTEDDIVDCVTDCDCPDIWDPVCIALPDNPFGGYLTFGNACLAECEGYTPDMFVQCDSTGCVCPEYYDPVCVVTEDGSVLTFDNQCFAECEGYYDYFYCDGQGDDCFASFFIEPIFTADNTFNFIDESWVINGEVTTWSWDFGDGSTSAEQNPTHTYESGGIFTVTLTITTSIGCESTFEDHICVGNGGFIDDYDCQSIFFFEQEDGLTYNFQDLSFGNPVSWSWDFGDGSGSDEQNPSHTYENNGLYIVTLTIATENCESSSSMILVAGENVDYQNDCFAFFIPFFADNSPFGIDSLGINGGVLFLNLSGADGTEVLWDFGDGTTSTEFMPFHIYEANDTYEVTLTITNADGCTSTFTSNVNVTTNEFVGSPEYSLTTATNKPEKAVQKVKVYPNPATDNVSVQFTLPQAGDYDLRVLDINGKVLKDLKDKGTQGVNIKNMTLDRLTNGMYFIQITSGQSTITTKFLKN